MTLANVVTVFRIILIPVFLFAFLSSAGYSRFLVAGIFVLSGISDVLDGYLARSRNEVSRFGTLVDPLADKMIMLAALWALVLVGQLPLWIALVVLLKEVGMIVGASVLLVKSDKVVNASNLGKTATVVLHLGVTLAILQMSAAGYIIILGVLVSITAGIDYLQKAIRSRNG